MKALLLVSVLAVAVLAGCTGNDGNTTSTTPAPGPVYQRYALPEDPMPEGDGHDHADPAQHKFLWNYELSAHDALQQNEASVAGLHAIDLQNGYLFGAVYGSHGASVDGGLQIWDVHSDPSVPVALGRWTIPGSVGGDRSMEATSDGEFAVISTEVVDCLGHVNPFGVVSAYLIDTSDKQLPVVADVLTFTGQTLGEALGGSLGQLGGASTGEHSVAVHNIQGIDYAFIFGKVYEIDRDEASGAKLRYVSEISTAHDVYVRDTPFNTTWALSANGGDNMIVYDVTDPAKPFQVGTWNLPEREELAEQGTEYYFHTVDVLWIAGKAIVTLASEDFGPHVSPFWVLDGDPMLNVTRGMEPVQLERIGTWSNPGNHTAANIGFSLHNQRMHDDGILTMSHYHGGLWQLDMRTSEFWADPAEVAYAVYAEGDPTAVRDPVEQGVENNLCGLGINLDAPMMMDVEVGPNGVLYGADVFLGLHTFTPTETHPVYGASRTKEYVGTGGQ